jgi:hypothetical protein
MTHPQTVIADAMNAYGRPSNAREIAEALDAAGLCIVDKSVVEALRECASAAYVSIDQCMDYGQINGWRNIATARIDIAKAALATLEAGE